MVVAALSFPVWDAKAGAHKDCQDIHLNTYRHADCERRYADLELAKLNKLTHSLMVEGKPFGLEKEIENARTIFIAYVEADCLLKVDTALYGGTAATYVIEECRSDYFRKRLEELRPTLQTLIGMRDMRPN